MDKVFNHLQWEENIYDLWEKAGAFKSQVGKKPYTILMPPPNANASLHAGHAMYTIDDIFIRYKRMRGYSALWIPGVDHAGFETQYVYEKELSKKGQSRMDFDRDTLYKNIFQFVQDNSGLIFKQFKRLGFSADWDRSVFTLDDKVISRVYDTFAKMESENLIYRDNYIVNYCTHCGTSLAELEVKHLERNDSLYYIKYPLTDGSGFVILATVRPETMFGDTAVAVNPKDTRYQDFVGKTLHLPLTNREIPIITDDMVDMEFGTGAVKITPAHDPNDFEAGKKHHLETIKVIDLRGRLTEAAGPFEGLKIKEAREKVVEKLKEENLIEKIDEAYLHSVTVCYKCGRDLEPSVIPNWFIKVNNLKKKVQEVVEKEEIKFHPKKFKRHMISWLEVMHDWPISRQIVWGIRIPVWYSTKDNPELNVTFLDDQGNIKTNTVKKLLENYSFSEIEKGLQYIIAPKGASYVVSTTKPGEDFLQETDTFDTWFSSGQWPLVTIAENEYQDLLPTDLMATLSDILKFWVSRMILFTLYLEKKIPFKNVYLWSMVADEKGVKMSKSKGNVVNPITLVDLYGADALRFSLLYGVPAGKKAILSDNKVRGMRNFSNKLWNVARFILEQKDISFPKGNTDNEDDLLILKQLSETQTQVTQALENYRLNEAAEALYDFIWHKLADSYLEKTKVRRAEAQTTLETVLLTCLKLLHPFMPFVTEAIYQTGFAKGKEDLLITATWPEAK